LKVSDYEVILKKVKIEVDNQKGPISIKKEFEVTYDKCIKSLAYILKIEKSINNFY